MDASSVYSELAGSGADCFRTVRLDEAQAFVADMFVPHGLGAPRAADQREVSVSRAYMGGVAMHAMDYGREVRIAPQPLADFYLIQVPVTGAARIDEGGAAHEVTVGEASLLPACDPIEMTWSADCRHLVIEVDRRTIEHEAELLLDRALPMPVKFDVHVPWSAPRLAPLRDAVGLLFDTWCSLRDHRWPTVLEDTLARTLCQTLLVSQRHNYSELLQAPGRHRIAPRLVRRAEEYALAHLGGALSVEDLARAAGVSLRCLQENFQTFRGVTPMQYVRERRMERVRADLSTATPGTSVTAVALRWGFTQLGRFAVEYRQLYGESPSETLRRGGRANARGTPPWT